MVSKQEIFYLPQNTAARGIKRGGEGRGGSKQKASLTGPSAGASAAVHIFLKIRNKPFPQSFKSCNIPKLSLVYFIMN